MSFRIGNLILLFTVIVWSCGSNQKNSNGGSDQSYKYDLVELQSGYDSTMISAALTSDKSVYKKGESPVIKTQIMNNTDHQIYLVHSLDGSSDFMRYPRFKYYLYYNDTLITHQYIRCGNVDGLSDDAFVRLGPGDSFDPNSSAPWVYQDHSIDSVYLTKKGKYKIKFYYSTAQDTLSHWVGWCSPLSDNKESKEKKEAVERLQSKFKNVPRISLYSNTLEFEIK